MSRQILCRKCGDNYNLHPSDKSRGLRMRRCYVSVVKPENHTMSINGVAHPVSKVTCDACTEDLHTKIGVAITEWSYGFNPEPRPWEHEYGTIISKEAADAAEVLGGKGSS